MIILFFLCSSKRFLKTFPTTDGNFHFDDKIAEMYAFQSVNAPIPKSWVFYIEEECVYNWLQAVNLYELFNEHQNLIDKLLKSERLFKKIIELTEGYGFTYYGYLLDYLTYDYSDEFKDTAITYIISQINDGHVGLANINLTKELIELNNPDLEKFLIDNYFSNNMEFR